MENVILYLRVSTDDQADKGFSLKDQEQKLLNYCSINNLNILGIFIDDHSAKDFNRPEFKKLYAFAKKNKVQINQVLFTKWSRFSRNTTESYNFIRDFHDINISVNAIEQPLDLSIPEQWLMLAVYLSMPEVENQRRSLNIIAGIRRAFKEGRYVVAPPKGYNMGRDDLDKPILIPNDDAKYITEAFELLSTGLYSQKEVLSKLQSKGFKTSRAAFGRIVRNQLYKGIIVLKAFQDEPEQIIKGIHRPLVPEPVFDKVQMLIDGNSRQYKVVHKKVNEKFPLKGFVLCPSCLKPLKASTSKGRSQYYSYYHCYKPCNTRYKAEDVENWFNSFLNGISLNKNAQKLLTKMIEKRFEDQTGSKRLSPKHYQEKESLEQKLVRLQDLYLDGEFDSNEYKTAKFRYQKRLNELEEVETSFNKSKEVLDVYRKGLKKLESFDKYFIDSNIELKRQLIGSIFPEKFQFENNEVRTADINPILLKIANVNKRLERNKKRDKSKKIDLSHEVQRVGFEPTET